MTQTPGIEGKLIITLRCSEDRNARLNASIASARPVQASQIFHGQPWQRALVTLPLLFNVCGQAQSVAGVRAVESALSDPASMTVEGRRDLLLDLESLREHLWRMLVDWPQLNGATTQVTSLVPLNKALTQCLRNANPEGQLTSQPGLQFIPQLKIEQEWQALRKQIESIVFGKDFLAWMRGETTAATEVLRLVNACLLRDRSAPHNSHFTSLPTLSQDFLQQTLQGPGADRFVAQPEYAGEQVETGTLARQRGHALVRGWIEQSGDGIGTRMAVRLFEVAQLLQRISSRLDGKNVHPYTPMKGGLAQVEAVRGRLVHSVQMDNTQIAEYRILAPTEWNFSNSGIAAALLNRLTGCDRNLLALQAQQIIHAVDPCVGFELQQEKAD